jgi:hypothetical protein
MGGGAGGDGGQVRDTQDLALLADLAHLFTHGVGGFAADVRVHFIKDEDRHFVLDGEDGFEGQHHAGHFAGRSDGAQRFGRLARVGRELEIDRVEPGE